VHLSNVRRISHLSDSDRWRISPNVCKTANKRRPPKETQDCHQRPRDAPCKALEERNNQQSARRDRKAEYTMRYISLSTLFGVSFGAQSWDPKLVVLRPQVLASSRRSKSHHTIGMMTTHFGLYTWSVWGTPFIQSNFFAQGPGFRAWSQAWCEFRYY